MFPMNHRAVMCLFHILTMGKQIIGDLMFPFFSPLLPLGATPDHRLSRKEEKRSVRRRLPLIVELKSHHFL